MFGKRNIAFVGAKKKFTKKFFLPYIDPNFFSMFSETRDFFFLAVCPKAVQCTHLNSSRMLSAPDLWSEAADGGWWEGEAIG